MLRNRVLAGDACFLPVAMSVRDLKEQVIKKLNEKHPDGLDAAEIKIPTESWISYQFSPKHPLHAASLHYTRALQIKHKVQARTLRATHLDSHYVASFFKRMKRLGVVAAQVIAKYTYDEDDVSSPVVFFSMDDKAKINVGEPHLAVSFGGRGRCSILPTDAKAIAGDHDFKIVSLSPSVTLRVEVRPDEGEDCTSYFRGKCILYLYSAHNLYLFYDDSFISFYR